MKTKAIELPKDLKKYINKWVVLDSRTMKVVVANKDGGKAVDLARKMGIVHPVLTRVPKNYGEAFIL